MVVEAFGENRVNTSVGAVEDGCGPYCQVRGGVNVENPKLGAMSRRLVTVSVR